MTDPLGAPRLGRALAPALGFWVALLAVGAGCRPRSSGYDAGPAPEDSGRLPLTPVALPELHCTPPASPAPDSECVRDGDCGGGARCVLDRGRELSDRAPIALRCGDALGDRGRRARCDSPSDCASGLCTLSGICVAPCGEQGDCALGEACQAVEIRLSDDALSPLSVCVRSVAVLPEATVEHVGRSDALSPNSVWEARFPIRDRNALLYLKTQCDREVQVQQVVTSDNLYLFNIGALFSGKPALNPVVNGGALLPVQIPNNPILPDLDGDYIFSVVVNGTTPLDRVAIWQTGSRSVLDLNVFYVGGGAFLVDGGFRPGSPQVQELMARLDRAYRLWGLRLGTIREYDVVGALRDEFGVLEASLTDGTDGPADLVIPRLGDLFALSAGVDDGGLNLFLLEDMGDVLGISGGIPGSLGVHGTPASGVALAVDVVGLTASVNVLMHEMSHQMGLLHTTEIDGFVMEPLGDTPECGAEYDESGDGILSADECIDHGAENLMFWAGVGSQLSPLQVEVLKASVALR